MHCCAGYARISRSPFSCPAITSRRIYITTCLFTCMHVYQPGTHICTLRLRVQGIVMEGNGGTAYFQFSLPPGVASVFLVIRVLASDDPDNSIDFYATRNTPWTKDSPERVDLESSHILPILTKDADSSIKAQGYEISSPVVCFYQVCLLVSCSGTNQ